MSTTAIIVSIYFVLMIGWGAFYFFKKRNWEKATLEGQFVGTRSYSTGYLLASLIAVWGSNNTLLAAAESGYDFGISGVFWYNASIIIPLLLFSWPLNIPKKIRELFPRGLTIGDVIGGRFDERTRRIALFILLLSNILFITSICLATGIILKTLLDINLTSAIIIGGVVMIIYTALGGFESLMYAHVFQLLLAGLAVTVAISVSVVELSLNGLITEISANSSEMLNVVAWGPSSMLAFLIANLGFIFAAPILYQLAFSGKSDKDVTRAFRLFPLLWAPFAVGTAIMGMIAFLIFPDIPAQEAAMILVNNVFPDWAAILFFLGGLALVFSTADATLNNLASLFIFDVYLKFKKEKNISGKKASAITMATVAILGIVGIVGAINFSDGILAILVLNGTVNIPMIFVVVLGLFWKRTHSDGAFWGMTLGISSIIILYYGFDNSIYTPFAGLIVSFVVIVALTLYKTDSNTDFITPIIENNKKDKGVVKNVE